MRIALVLFVVGILISSASCLRCWRCINARSQDDCRRDGESQLCRRTETVCQTEVRYFEGRNPMITTKCKEHHACYNNEIQNPRMAWLPTQCNRGKKNSVCRCCCSGDYCNRENLVCEPKPIYRPLLPDSRRDVQPRTTTFPSSRTECRGFPKRLRNGQVDCDNGKYLGSTCTFSCNNGYELVGRLTTSCTFIRNRLMWKGRTPVCREITGKCSSVDAPQNGRVVCTDSTLGVGAECAFRCDVGFTLNGAERVQCIKDVNSDPRWNDDIPTCIDDTCDAVIAPFNGQVRCSGSGRVGTDCTFVCNTGLELEGSSSTSCVMTDTGPQWSNERPICNGRCRQVDAPANGRVDCSGSGEIGTECDFACDNGLDLVGFEQISCVLTATGPQWSEEAPTCDGTCPLLGTLENGGIKCSGNGEMGTSCAFICNNGARMTGQPGSDCEMTPTGPQWTNEIPICEYFCAPIVDPENGQVQCSGSGEEGTFCIFYCDDGYEMTGQSTASCDRAAEGVQWSNGPPTCTEIPRVCPDLGALQNGNISCTDDENFVGTECSFQCSSDYQLLPNDRFSTECIVTEGISRWSKRKPCCNAQCPPLSRKDIVILIDSSRSVSDDDWRLMIDFIVNVIERFVVSEEFLQIAAFRFNRDVDTTSQILLGESKEDLIFGLKNMPKNGGGTRIDRALQHAKDVVLKDVRNRKDVGDMIWMVTDGKTREKAAVTKVAKELRDSGVEMIAVGIAKEEDQEGKELLAQLADITGDSDLVMQVESFADSLINDFLEKVADKICEVSCDQ